jgi:hypothetical protein
MQLARQVENARKRKYIKGIRGRQRKAEEGRGG